jgi:6-pyruvoyltetrahydropterin/6-carboxytetrahydropterin synthase
MSGTLYLTKKVGISAAHRLHNAAWSEEKNLAVFGKCARPGGHGHNYVLEVTVCGRADPDTGMVIDLKTMKEIIRREVWARCDHRDFNRDVPFMKGRIPTAENIVIAMWEVLEPAFGKGILYRLRLHETDRNVVEYYGPEDGEDAAAAGRAEAVREERNRS